MFDEPFLELTPVVILTIFEAIKHINQEGTTVPLVEENARMALGIANSGYLLEAGQIVLSGEAKQSAQCGENETGCVLDISLEGGKVNNEYWKITR